MGLTEEELPDIVARWRASNKRIVDLWYQVDNATLDCVMTGMPQSAAKCWISMESSNGLYFMTIALPSGRKLYYPKPTIKENQFGKPAIYYQGMEQGKKKWTEIGTYGGKLTENIVQAIARDCLAMALKRVSDAGFNVVMHVHDEIIAEHEKMPGTLEYMNELLAQPIIWAPGLLLKGDGFMSDFYKKD